MHISYPSTTLHTLQTTPKSIHILHPSQNHTTHTSNHKSVHISYPSNNHTTGTQTTPQVSETHTLPSPIQHTLQTTSQLSTYLLPFKQSSTYMHIPCLCLLFEPCYPISYVSTVTFQILTIEAEKNAYFMEIKGNFTKEVSQNSHDFHFFSQQKAVLLQLLKFPSIYCKWGNHIPHFPYPCWPQKSHTISNPLFWYLNSLYQAQHPTPKSI